MNIHQVLSGAGPFDAITTEALGFRSCFTSWNWGGRDYAARIAPGMHNRVLPSAQLTVEPDDVLLLHHSAHNPRLDELLALPCRKLVLYHNITPAGWMWDHAPVVAVHCAAGRGQLPEILAAVDVVAADSAFNAAELEAFGAHEPQVIPLWIDFDRLGTPGEPSRTQPKPQLAADGVDASKGVDAAEGAPTVLFVGRLAPHKRPDEVIRIFALYRQRHAPRARLALVGDPITPGYVEHLRRLADALAPGAVTIESGLSNAELGDRYRAADVFLCLSAHEGFCIPILEAMHLGVPVISRPSGAIPETAGDAALLVDDEDPSVVVELVHLVVTDDELRGELIRRGREQVRTFARARVAERLRSAVEGAAAAGTLTE